MRENRTYGSEGGAAAPNRPSLPLSTLIDSAVLNCCATSNGWRPFSPVQLLLNALDLTTGHSWRDREFEAVYGA